MHLRHKSTDFADPGVAFQKERLLKTKNRTSKVLVLFSGYYPSHCGGIELVCADLIKGLCDLGRKVNWVALESEHPGIHANCTIEPLAGTDLVYRRWGIPFPLLRIHSFTTVWKAVRRASVVMIAEANFMISIFAFVFAKMQRKPILLMQHVGAPSTVSRFAAVAMRLAELLFVRPMLRSADQVVYVSPIVANHFAGLNTRRAPEIIGHGVDTDLFAPAASENEKLSDRAQLGIAARASVATFAGRCTVSKGIEVFLQMAKLRPDWHFVVAGNGPVDFASYQQANLKWLGQVDRTTLSRVYRASDVLVLPSRYESFSLVVREALACGTKVLCGDQILGTDPTLEKWLVTRPVDLEAPDVSAQIFAAALDEHAPRPALDGRAYVINQCSWDAIFKRYAFLLDGLQHWGRSVE